jgi:endoglycosylceramidase
MPRSWRRLALALVLAGCGHPTSGPPAGPRARTDPDAVHVVGRTFRDGRGRQLLFRGYNAKATVLFDVTFSDGRTPNETFDDFDEAAAARIEQLGFNVLRLPVSWSGLEPQPKQYSKAFLDKLVAVLALAREHHFYVFIDMHQDAYSKEIGEDGAPLWAIVPPPAMVLSGPSNDSRRLTSQVLNAGFSFFADAQATDGRPLQEAFIAAVQQIAKLVVGNPVVLGYEAFNEPVVLREAELDAFHASFADGIHAIDADAPVLFEPVATRNQVDMAAIPGAPWSHGPGVYAPHIYTAIFSVPDQMSWASMDPKVLAPSMAAASNEATAWGTPLFVTEFGCDQSTTRGPQWISDEMDLQDQYLASSTVWEFSGRGAWGFYANGSTEHPATTKVVSRTFPRAVAGDLVAIERPAPGHLVVHWKETPETKGLPNEVAMSADYATGYQVLCDGAPVAFTQDTGRATFTCPEAAGDRTFEVVGTPVP